MKKTALLLLIIFSLSILPMNAFAQGWPLRVVVNGEEVIFPDAQPFLDSNGRTQTPARFIGEALGAKVTWDEKTRKATFVMGSKKLVLYIGKKEYEVNGLKKKMDTAAILKESRTFVPARYVAEAFGATVLWDQPIQTVYISIDNTKVDTGETRNVLGLIVPKDTNIGVVELTDDLNCEILLSIGWLKPDIEKQKDDLEKIMLQKFGQTAVKQVMDHVRRKITEDVVLESKTIYDTKTNQYIWIAPSRSNDITIWIAKKGIKPMN